MMASRGDEEVKGRGWILTNCSSFVLHVCNVEINEEKDKMQCKKKNIRYSSS